MCPYQYFWTLPVERLKRINKLIQIQKFHINNINNVHLNVIKVIEERRLPPETQYGLRKNRSTTDVLITLDSLISEAIRKREYTVLLSLDIYKAYDTC
jgi:hypothetical protein